MPQTLERPVTVAKIEVPPQKLDGLESLPTSVYVDEIAGQRRAHRFTVSQCKLLDEVGVISGKYELINGEIYAKMPTNPPHRYTLNQVAMWLEKVYGRVHVFTQDTVPVSGDYSRPQPDIVVLNKSQIEFPSTHPRPEDVVMLVEISDSTLVVRS